MISIMSSNNRKKWTVWTVWTTLYNIFKNGFLGDLYNCKVDKNIKIKIITTPGPSGPFGPFFTFEGSIN